MSKSEKERKTWYTYINTYTYISLCIYVYITRESGGGRAPVPTSDFRGVGRRLRK